MEVKDRKDNNNIEVRADFDSEGRIICVAEMKLAKDLTPDDFKNFFLNHWPDSILEINPLLSYAANVDEVENCNVIRTTAKAPWPNSDRGMVVC
jgi:hypothetical protein